MTVTLPPELMSVEERGARATELERKISREWLRFAITEAVLIWIPFAVFLVAYVTEAISDAARVPVVVVAIASSSALVLYWAVVRVRPLQRELESLKQYDRSA